MRQFAAILMLLLAWIPLCWQPLWGQTPGVRVDSGHKPKQQADLSRGQPQKDQRGTQNSPLIVETHDRTKTDKEAAEAQKDKDQADFVNRWMLRFTGAAALFTGLLVLVGAGGIYAAIRTLRAIEEQEKLMKRQTDIMASQFETTQPRLYIDRVRAVSLVDGEEPMFFVRIMNSGIVAAEKVAISLKAETAGISVQAEDRVITIPANAWRECFIRSPARFDEGRLKELRTGKVPLRISGHIKWNGKTTEYCYNYTPWPYAKRPKGFPTFIPCDFDASVRVTMEINAEMARLLAATETQSPEPPENPEQAN